MKTSSTMAPSEDSVVFRPPVCYPWVASLKSQSDFWDQDDGGPDQDRIMERELSYKVIYLKV